MAALTHPQNHTARPMSRLLPSLIFQSLIIIALNHYLSPSASFSALSCIIYLHEVRSHDLLRGSNNTAASADGFQEHNPSGRHHSCAVRGRSWTEAEWPLLLLSSFTTTKDWIWVHLQVATGQFNGFLHNVWELVYYYYRFVQFGSSLVKEVCQDTALIRIRWR
jgi:hypothetical protein